ncbi:PP2C family protein-serine/threonine phosphatase [Jatrophihabitans sp. DSM 45814]
MVEPDVVPYLWLYMINDRFRRSLQRLRPRRERPTERVELSLCLFVLIAGTAWSISDNNRQIKVASVMIIVIVVSSLILTSRSMWILTASIAVCLTIVFAVHGLNSRQLSVSGFVMISIALVVAVAQARRRDRLGLRQVSAEKVIGLIRDRLLVQAQLPEVPTGWSVDIEQRPADGAAIAGDFVSNRLVRNAAGEQILHLAVIDVSGSGIAAGPRALLLSGAVGGLLGSVEPEKFLTSANDYLSRQQWSLGFASAIYVQLNLSSGAYEIRVAGHPPAVHFRPSATPPWRISTATGTVLGVLPNLAGVSDADVLEPGEALFLYTDGVVEDRTRDLDAGTQRLKDSVELLATQNSWQGVSQHLIEGVPATQDDDRTMVMIRRDPIAVVAQAVAAPSMSGAARNDAGGSS